MDTSWVPVPPWVAPIGPDLSEAAIAASTCLLVTQAIALYACQLARRHSCRDVIFTGGFLAGNELARRKLIEEKQQLKCWLLELPRANRDQQGPNDPNLRFWGPSWGTVAQIWPRGPILVPGPKKLARAQFFLDPKLDFRPGAQIWAHRDQQGPLSPRLDPAQTLRGPGPKFGPKFWPPDPHRVCAGSNLGL